MTCLESRYYGNMDGVLQKVLSDLSRKSALWKHGWSIAKKCEVSSLESLYCGRYVWSTVLQKVLSDLSGKSVVCKVWMGYYKKC